MTKTFTLKDGVVEKLPGGSLSAGECATYTFTSLEDFAASITKLKPHQAVAYGVPAFEGDAWCVLSGKKFLSAGSPEGVLTRTRKNFTWPEGPGLLMLDYDPQPGTDPLSPDEFQKTLLRVCPPLAGTGMVQWFSASSFVRKPDGSFHSEVQGQRIWIPIQDASDIPRAGQILYDRLWLAGFGRMDISKNGQTLERSLIDSSVWQPERLDFVAGARCLGGLVQERPAPRVIEGSILDSWVALPDLAEDESRQLSEIKSRLRQRSALRLPGVVPETGQTSILYGKQTIILENGTHITVKDVLTRPDTLDGSLTRDPLEPDYQGGKVCGKLFLSQKESILHSFAHGGRSYRLLSQDGTINIRPGQTAEAVTESFKLLRDSGLFVSTCGLCTVDKGEGAATIRPMCEARLQNFVGKQLIFEREEKKQPQRIDPPLPLIKQMLATAREHGLPKLEGIARLPMLTLDGVLHDRPGYNPIARCYLDFDVKTWPGIPEHVGRFTPADIRSLVEKMLRPFRGFPFCSDQDKAVLLAMIFTGLMLPSVDMRPAFAVDAPCPASGKTLLVRMVAYCVEGKEAGLVPGSEKEEETGKRLFALLLEGRSCVVFDNLEGGFGSGKLCSTITSPVLTDRILGNSQTRTVENRSLIILTGNNISLKGDMAVRRVLTCKIDPAMERPHERRFSFNALAEVASKRMEMVAAGLSLMMDHSKKYGGKTITPKGFSAYPQWDFIRQATYAITGEAWGECIDVADAFYSRTVQDPELATWQDVLEKLAKFQAGVTHGPFTCKELWEYAQAETDFLEILVEGLGQRIANARSLGNLFARRKDRFMGGLVLKERGKDRSKTALSQLRQN